MKAVYSTQMDKQLSEGEIDLHYPNQSDSNKSGSNYENDEFEDEDLDDDFNLPRDHLQNNESFGQFQPNIRDQVKKQKNLLGAPHYTSTGSQATNELSNSKKKKGALEEEKQPSRSNNNVARASKEQLE